ncbi:hypothetical protein HPB50_007946 [Hyalomma asiaticum]|uniref:Uncharacterized protein n=1 Tax=Hyalomma asiaticum TaxID=266040 RepID=A0ACB7S7S4_HYAAI|nr:hypothetical protein HPB50_007946 [Hyalomma asiaticum]
MKNLFNHQDLPRDLLEQSISTPFRTPPENHPSPSFMREARTRDRGPTTHCSRDTSMRRAISNHESLCEPHCPYDHS